MRIAALLLAVNSIVLVAGVVTGGSMGAKRPWWVPSVWIRAGVLLVVAGGLWYGQPWAWWIAVAMCVGLLLWTGIASVVLALGKYFAGEGAVLRLLHVGLLVGTWLAALAILLSPSGRLSGST